MSDDPSDRDDLADRVADMEGELRGLIHDARRDLPAWLFERNRADLWDAGRLLGVVYESLLSDKPLAHEVDKTHGPTP